MNKKKGFTILEVMVAMAIVGVSIGIFFSLVGNSLRLRGKIDDHTKSLLLARTKTEESFLGILGDRYRKLDEKRIYKDTVYRIPGGNGLPWEVLEVDVHKEAKRKATVNRLTGQIYNVTLPPKGVIMIDTQVEGINVDTVSLIKRADKNNKNGDRDYSEEEEDDDNE